MKKQKARSEHGSVKGSRLVILPLTGTCSATGKGDVDGSGDDAASNCDEEDADGGSDAERSCRTSKP